MKPSLRLLLPLVLFAAAAPLMHAQAAPAPPEVQPTPQPAKDEADIRAAIAAQADAWNRGDIPIFMQSYEDSPDTTFIGQSVGRGYQPILQRYQKSYSNREQMGTLTFSDIDVRLLPSGCGHSEIALVTGRFHLDRATHGEAAKDDGIFSLVWRKGPHGWKIILDHTSS
ncbi:MAG TPA: nuclear transport factor 2 family protein [Terracidiphilus sp.]|nr:nuclear transport factor 2 family protein [Terracidiphilus sp.]